MSSKAIGENQPVYSISDDIKIMIHNKTSDLVGELFGSLLAKYQISLEASMNDSSFLNLTVMMECVTNVIE